MPQVKYLNLIVFDPEPHTSPIDLPLPLFLSLPLSPTDPDPYAINTSMPLRNHNCFNCGEYCPQTARKCSRCWYTSTQTFHRSFSNAHNSITRYCSKRCQKEMWPVHGIFCGSRGIREQTAVEEELYRQSHNWLRVANPVVFQYAIWALNIPEFGIDFLNQVWYVVGSCDLGAYLTLLSPTAASTSRCLRRVHTHRPFLKYSSSR